MVGSLAASAPTLGPLDDWKSKRIAQGDLFPWMCQVGRAARSSGKDGGTQRRDARSGQRHTPAEDIKMAALEALLPEELERHCQLQRSRLDTYQTLREEVVLYAEARGYVAPKLDQVAKAREDRDDPMDVGGFGQWKVRPTFKGKEKNPVVKGREQESMVQSHQDKRTRKRFKVIVGIAGKQVTNQRIAGQGHSSNKTKDNRILLERETM